jgi:RNA polymerase sigma-70 factor, ECF subfamily
MTVGAQPFERRERFERLFDQHYRAVCAYALRRAVPGDADDVVAETFFIAWRRLEEVPAEAKPWLLGVARRVLANQRRAAGRRAALIARVAGAAPGAADRPTGTPVLRALALLSGRDREVLLLTAWEGLSLEEATAVMGCSRTATKVRLHRARRRLRGKLDQLQSEPASPRTTRRLEQCHDE